MNNRIARSLTVSAGLALGITLGGVAQAEEADGSALTFDRTRLAEATLNLENAFADQFVRGAVDPAALSGAIDEAVQAQPEEHQPVVKEHIGRVLEAAQNLASDLDPEERADMAAPAEEVGEADQKLIAGWGWGGRLGFGGVGAFGFPRVGLGLGFPGLGFGGLGYGLGVRTGLMGGWGLGYGLGGCGGIGYGLGGIGLGVGYGVGLGCGAGIGVPGGLGW